MSFRRRWSNFKEKRGERDWQSYAGSTIGRLRSKAAGMALENSGGGRDHVMDEDRSRVTQSATLDNSESWSCPRIIQL